MLAGNFKSVSDLIFNDICYICAWQVRCDTNTYNNVFNVYAKKCNKKYIYNTFNDYYRCDSFKYNNCILLDFKCSDILTVGVII